MCMMEHGDASEQEVKEDNEGTEDDKEATRYDSATDEERESDKEDASSKVGDLDNLDNFKEISSNFWSFWISCIIISLTDSNVLSPLGLIADKLTSTKSSPHLYVIFDTSPTFWLFTLSF